MFLGEFQHTIDPKGRIVLPAKLRDDLADGCVITRGQDHCLYVFPMDRWHYEEERISSLPRTERRFRDYSRSFFSGAMQQALDRQGRIQVPPKLREYAGLDKEVVVIGAGDRIEVWDAVAFDEIISQADDYYSDIQEALSDIGI